MDEKDLEKLVYSSSVIVDGEVTKDQIQKLNLDGYIEPDLIFVARDPLLFGYDIEALTEAYSRRGPIALIVGTDFGAAESQVLAYYLKVDQEIVLMHYEERMIVENNYSYAYKFDGEPKECMKQRASSLTLHERELEHKIRLKNDKRPKRSRENLPRIRDLRRRKG